MMSKISFIYFDVGGVAIKDFSDSDKWDKMKADIGVNQSNYQIFEELWAENRGRICIDYDVDKLIPRFKELNLSISPNYSMLADFVNRFEKNVSIWPILESLHKKKKIGLLTNMYPRMFGQIENNGLLPPINWDKIIDSSLVKYQKPDLKIFQIAAKEAGVEASKILFVDNQQKHLDGAAAAGWQTYLYDSRDYDQATKDLSSYLAKSNL